MAKDQGATPTVTKGAKGHPRATAPVKAPVVAPKQATRDAPKKKINPATFFQEVRAEGRKVTWTSWKETWITSVMVAIMVVVTSIFFSVVDGALSFLMQQFLRLAGG
jgi:preprotein translocase subunit SecE